MYVIFSLLITCPFSVLVSRLLTLLKNNSKPGTKPLQCRLWTRCVLYRGYRERVETWRRPCLDMQDCTSRASEGRQASRDNRLIFATGFGFSHATGQSYITPAKGRVQHKYWAQHIASSFVTLRSMYIVALVLTCCAFSSSSVILFELFFSPWNGKRVLYCVVPSDLRRPNVRKWHNGDLLLFSVCSADDHTLIYQWTAPLSMIAPGGCVQHRSIIIVSYRSILAASWQCMNSSSLSQPSVLIFDFLDSESMA